MEHRNQRLAELTSKEFGALLEKERTLVVLLAVGSVEPHGPHLPLATDTIISEAAMVRAQARLRGPKLDVLLAPPIAYGVTEFARGFPGTVGIRPGTLTTLLEDVVGSLLSAGASHVCIVNNHLEPEHDKAVRAVVPLFNDGRVAVACPLTRRHARTLSAEFKSGACHAGSYETSIVMAAEPGLVRDDKRLKLAEVPVSLSEGIGRGESTFIEMGMKDAYAGAPAAATAEHGDEQLELLASMIEIEVREGLAKVAVQAR
jgi:creatinine amidohydrolase